MKLKDMKTGIRYVVTKSGSMFAVGNHIWIDETGCLLCREAQGWLTEDEWKWLRNEAAFDVEHYLRRKRFLTNELADIIRLIAENTSEGGI